MKKQVWGLEIENCDKHFILQPFHVCRQRLRWDPGFSDQYVKSFCSTFYCFICQLHPPETLICSRGWSLLLSSDSSPPGHIRPSLASCFSWGLAECHPAGACSSEGRWNANKALWVFGSSLLLPAAPTKPKGIHCKISCDWDFSSCVRQLCKYLIIRSI